MTDPLTPSELDALAATITEQAAAAREALADADKALYNIRAAKSYLAGIDFGLKSGLETYGAPIAQASADALMAELAAKGLLRNPRATIVKRVERDKAGNIKAIVETEE